MIQWYPGHMHKASKEFKKILPQVDLVIEVLDARLPFSSQNPMLAKLRGVKPSINILNKSDLSDEQRLTIWQAKLEESGAIKTLTTNLQNNSIAGLNELCRQLIPKRLNRGSMIYAMLGGTALVGNAKQMNRMS